MKISTELLLINWLGLILMGVFVILIWALGSGCKRIEAQHNMANCGYAELGDWGNTIRVCKIGEDTCYIDGVNISCVRSCTCK